MIIKGTNFLIKHQPKRVITHQALMLELTRVVIQQILMITPIDLLILMSNASRVLHIEKLIENAEFVVREWTYL